MIALIAVLLINLALEAIENGYIRLKRESTTQCGTDNTPLMGTGCVDDGNDVQTVCGICGVLFDVVYPIGVGYVEA